MKKLAIPRRAALEEETLGATRPAETPPAGARRAARRNPLARAGILIPFVILFVVLSATSGPFLTKVNIVNILGQQSSTLIIAAASTLVLISGAIDLSVGATYALAGVISADVAVSHPAVLAVLAGLAAGAAVGLVNGIISTTLRINSLIATLAMSFVVEGVAAKITNGNLIQLINRTGFGSISLSQWITIPSIVWIAAVVVVACGLVLARTTWGRYVYAVGGNAQAARLAGVRVNSTRIIAFTAAGLAAALGGIVDVARVATAQASIGGSTLTFTVLAGVVVGGTSILGGEGAIWRTAVGVLFIALVGNGFDLLGVDPLYQQIVLGVILLLAVGIDAWTRVRSAT